jgi:Flp pilus assembly protein TadD
LNLCIHILNVLLLFGVLIKMTGRIGASAMVAALFGLHPINVESVAWISERKNVLSLFFALLTVWAYSSYVKNPGWKKYALALLAFALGLMAKPMIVTLPFLLLLLDFWPLKRHQSPEAAVEAGLAASSDASKMKMKKRSGKGKGPEESRADQAKMQIGITSQNRSANLDVPAASVYSPNPFHLFFRLAREKIPFFILAALSCAITLYAQKMGGTVKSFEAIPFQVRLSNALVSYAQYLFKAAWPARLAVFYPYPAVALPFWTIALAFIFLAAVTWLVFWHGRQHPYVPVGWLWFLGTLIPMIGLVQAGDQAMADRYAYLPLVGIFILATWSLEDWTARKHLNPRWAVYCLLVLLLCFAVLSRQQVATWKNDRTLFEQALRVTGDTFVACNGMGKVLADEGNLEDAAGYLKKALELKPNYPPAVLNLAGVENNRGAALARLKEYDQAIPYYQRAISLRPDLVEFRCNLAGSLAANGKSNNAIAQYEQAIQLQPGNARAHRELGILLSQQGRFVEALSQLQMAAKLQPDAVTYFRMGIILGNQRRIQESQAAFQQALKFNPRYEPAQQALQRLSAFSGK